MNKKWYLPSHSNTDIYIHLSPKCTWSHLGASVIPTLTCTALQKTRNHLGANCLHWNSYITHSGSPFEEQKLNVHIFLPKGQCQPLSSVTFYYIFIVTQSWTFYSCPKPLVLTKMIIDDSTLIKLTAFKTYCIISKQLAH